MTKIELGDKVSDRDLLVMAVQSINAIDEKLDTMSRILESHSLSIATISYSVSANTKSIIRHDEIIDTLKQMPKINADLNRRIIIIIGSASAAGGGIIMSVADEVIKRFFGG